MRALSRVAERVGADIERVRQGIGSDPRIGMQFLYAGAGYGGSCFPKDVKALARSAAEAGSPLQLLAAVEAINEQQKLVLVEKIARRFGEDLHGMTFSLWGLAYKPNTDDMRGAPSRVIVAELTRRGAKVRAYDPVAAQEAARVMGSVAGLSIVDSAATALEGADALAIVTEWSYATPRDRQLSTS